MDEFRDQLNLRQELIPAGMQNRSGRKIAPTAITVHNTSNTGKGANAAAHAKFVTKTGYYVLASGKKNWVSWHFTVDDREAVQHLPIDERAIHAGPGNGSLGIEVCMHQGIDQAEADLRAARLVAKLLNDLDLPSSAVVTHKSWTGKNCPERLLQNWQAFLQKVAAERAKLPANLVEDRLFAPPEDYRVPQDEKGFEEATEANPDGEIDHPALKDALPSDED